MASARIAILAVGISGLLAGSPGCSRNHSPESAPAATSAVRAGAPAESSTPARTVFEPTVAGRFYPAEEASLRSAVRSFIAGGAASERTVPAGRRIVAVVAPHAGYVYSGPVAGHSYAAVASRDFHTVIVLGPSHHVLRDRAALLGVEAYRTPLGELPIATDIAQALLKRAPELFRIDPEAFQGEHSVEVQLPFIQVALPKARVVPVVVPSLSADALDRIAELLFREFGRDPSVLVVASSDLSHFFSYDEAKQRDQAIMEELRRSDVRALLDHAEARRGPCGVAPIVIALDYLRRFDGAKAIDTLEMKNSGDTTDVGHDRVVGYGSFAFSVAP